MRHRKNGDLFYIFPLGEYHGRQRGRGPFVKKKKEWRYMAKCIVGAEDCAVLLEKLVTTNTFQPE